MTYQIRVRIPNATGHPQGVWVNAHPDHNERNGILIARRWRICGGRHYDESTIKAMIHNGEARELVET